MQMQGNVQDKSVNTGMQKLHMHTVQTGQDKYVLQVEVQVH